MKRIPCWKDNLVGRIVWSETFQDRGIITGPGEPHTCAVQLDKEDGTTMCRLAELELLEPPTCATCKHMDFTPDAVGSPYTCGLINMEEWVASQLSANAKVEVDASNTAMIAVLAVTPNFGCVLHEPPEDGVMEDWEAKPNE